jgi:hypothetical protein
MYLQHIEEPDLFLEMTTAESSHPATMRGVGEGVGLIPEVTRTSTQETETTCQGRTTPYRLKDQLSATSHRKGTTAGDLWNDPDLQGTPTVQPIRGTEDQNNLAKFSRVVNKNRT